MKCMRLSYLRLFTALKVTRVYITDLEKSNAALKRLEKFHINQRAVVFVEIFARWFTIMSVKENFKQVLQRNVEGQPWVRVCLLKRLKVLVNYFSRVHGRPLLNGI